MAASTRMTSFLQQLPLWWHNRWAAMRALEELDRSPHAEVLRTASDFGLTVEALRSAVARGPLDRRLMERMAETYGLAPTALRRVGLSVAREMEARCTFCGKRRRCSIDLSDADGASRAQTYCPNAEIFRDLVSRMDGSSQTSRATTAALSGADRADIG
ncbi:MAG TPA: DUF6455 family protein [Hyphomicrobiaceae bacterium]|nr:DUF6455 family protein [Hyphomicrobiaceae bacterium]